MNGNYVIKNKAGDVLNFYFENNGIFFKEYNGGKWKEKGCLAEQVRDHFTVNISDDGSLYLICQSVQGDVILLNQAENKWNKKIILKSCNENGNNILFYALIHKEEMELVYLIDYGNRKSEIMTQSVGKKGNNSGARLMDSALSLPEGCFKMQRIYNRHYIIFYQKREAENQLGYKEINTQKQSEYIVFHKTGYRITDSSFIADKSGIHFLYIVKSIFSSQVIYRKKDDKGLSNPVVLYEGQGISLCSLFFAGGSLYASWIMNRQLFYAVSKTQGEDFDRVVRDKKYSCINWIKANYLGFNEMNKETFLANEIFTDVKKGMEPVFVTDFYNEFYAKKASEDDVKTVETPKTAKTGKIKSEDVSIMLERMKNQIEIAQNQSDEKDRQLIQLNNIIQAKNREIIQIEANLMKKINELREEIKELKKVNKEISENTVVKAAKAEDKAPLQLEAKEETEETEEI